MPATVTPTTAMACPAQRQPGPVGADIEGRISPGFHLSGILSPRRIDRSGHAGAVIALACFVGPAIMWIVPDRRIDRMVRHHEAPD